MKGPSFLQDMERATGERISACYQCYRCSNSCPVVTDMDIMPHRLIRYIILGEREKVLGANTMWTCLQCLTCSMRCPNDIDVARVFNTLRSASVEAGRPAAKDLWHFDRIFLESVRRHGRLHELEAVMRYKLLKKSLFDDTKMGLSMFTKGRMGILPHNIRDRGGLRRLFQKAERLSAVSAHSATVNGEGKTEN